MKNRNFFFLIIGVLFLIPCNIFAQNRFSKRPDIQRIYEHQFNRNRDSLLMFFSDKNPVLRKEAYLGFASIQDTVFVPALLAQLQYEKIDSLRFYLIFSLGQFKSRHASDKLQQLYSHENKGLLLSVYLEAIGKIPNVNLHDFYLNAFKKVEIPDITFYRSWLRGVYYAKRNSGPLWNPDKDTLFDILSKISNKINLEKHPDMAFFHEEISTNKAPEKIIKQEIEIVELSELLDKMNQLENPFTQLDLLKTYRLADSISYTLALLDLPSLINYYALDIYLSKYSHHHGLTTEFLKEILQKGDIALISRVCEYVTLNNLKKDSVFQLLNAADLTVIQQKLQLPRELETYIDLEKAILSYEGKKYHYTGHFNPDYYNTLDWDYIEKVSQNQRVKIETTKGSIVIICKINESPGAVTNFLKLVDIGYYHDKYFHRYVPGFVVQGGCPRGDGWGSLDRISKSEFSNTLTYKPGSLGLASVGKDSEGVQFFFSLRYTPHLDGRYTIFAEVIEGMDVVNKLRAGDKILHMSKIED